MVDRTLLVAGTVVAVVAGVAAGALAGDATVLESNWVFRIIVGGATTVVLYIGVVALWLALQGRTFKRLGVLGASAETDDETALEIRLRDREIAEFMGTTTKAIEELERRVEAIERGADARHRT